MDEIIEYGSIEAIPRYNCSGHSSEMWTEFFEVRHPIIGTFDVLFGFIINILYIPILAVMYQPMYFKMSCFKIMIFLGVIDMLALYVNSIITGVLAIQGTVWCTFPNFNYIVGMIILRLWCCSCCSALMLVANRLMDLTKPQWAMIWFEGNRTYIALAVSVMYGLYFTLFTNPVGFNSKYYTWLFDPIIDRNPSADYHNIAHSINNLLVVAVTCILYTWLYVVIGEQIRMSTRATQRQNLSLQILVQSTMICSINLVASCVFVLMNFVELPIWVIIVTHKAWQFIHGAPVIIYLTLNKTIRSGVLKKLQSDIKIYRSRSVAPQ
ncbi:unnamed protein product [Caenorhabditis sp. 36 PRJEB53466]|nr:unnamed protein product [Caenorhabditis sp. 36 PRJEB53466]